MAPETSESVAPTVEQRSPKPPAEGSIPSRLATPDPVLGRLVRFYGPAAAARREVLRGLAQALEAKVREAPGVFGATDRARLVGQELAVELAREQVAARRRSA